MLRFTSKVYSSKLPAMGQLPRWVQSELWQAFLFFCTQSGYKVTKAVEVCFGRGLI